MLKLGIIVICLFAFFAFGHCFDGIVIDDSDSQNNTIEGKVFFPLELPMSSNWISDTRVIVNYGAHLGFLR